METNRYCEFCGSLLDENGKCTVEDCINNLLQDALEENKKDDASK